MVDLEKASRASVNDVVIRKTSISLRVVFNQEVGITVHIQEQDEDETRGKDLGPVQHSLSDSVMNYQSFIKLSATKVAGGQAFIVSNCNNEVSSVATLVGKLADGERLILTFTT